MAARPSRARKLRLQRPPAHPHRGPAPPRPGRGGAAPGHRSPRDAAHQLRRRGRQRGPGRPRQLPLGDGGGRSDGAGAGGARAGRDRARRARDPPALRPRPGAAAQGDRAAAGARGGAAAPLPAPHHHRRLVDERADPRGLCPLPGARRRPPRRAASLAHPVRRLRRLAAPARRAACRGVRPRVLVPAARGSAADARAAGRPPAAAAAAGGQPGLRRGGASADQGVGARFPRLRREPRRHAVHRSPRRLPGGRAALDRAGRDARRHAGRRARAGGDRGADRLLRQHAGAAVAGRSRPRVPRSPGASPRRGAGRLRASGRAVQRGRGNGAAGEPGTSPPLPGPVHRAARAPPLAGAFLRRPGDAAQVARQRREVRSQHDRHGARRGGPGAGLPRRHVRASDGGPAGGPHGAPDRGGDRRSRCTARGMRPAVGGRAASAAGRMERGGGRRAVRPWARRAVRAPGGAPARRRRRRLARPGAHLWRARPPLAPARPPPAGARSPRRGAGRHLPRSPAGADRGAARHPRRRRLLCPARSVISGGAPAFHARRLRFAAGRADRRASRRPAAGCGPRRDDLLGQPGRRRRRCRTGPRGRRRARGSGPFPGRRRGCGGHGLRDVHLRLDRPPEGSAGAPARRRPSGRAGPLCQVGSWRSLPAGGADLLRCLDVRDLGAAAQ